jgi:hypothetical protein
MQDKLAPRKIPDQSRIGAIAIERLMAEIGSVQTVIDAQPWTALEKLDYFHQILGTFGSWCFSAMPPESCAAKAEALMARTAARIECEGEGRKMLIAAPSGFH